MSKAAFDAKLSAIEALKSDDAGPSRDAALGKALADRNNYIAAKAARVAGEVLARALIPDLIAAFDRFMANPAKSDPQCWAKIAIIKALSALGRDDPDVFIRGARHVQMEPVWGGQEDMACSLRAACASALVECRGIGDLDALELLIELLVDRDKAVRAGAARAIGRIQRREAALVLRLRTLAGDAEPEPLGALYSALLGIEGKHGIPFIARFLDAGGDAAQEAALALGETHDPAAFELLRSALHRDAEPALRVTLFASIALTRLPEAIELLMAEAQAGSKEAVQALTAIPLSDAQKSVLDEILSRRE